MKRTAIISLLLLLLGLVFLKYGRSVYMPAVNLIRGQETVASVLEKTEAVVWKRLKADLQAAGYTDFPGEIMLVAFKEEQKLQVYAKNQKGTQLIKEYPFTAYSGQLGPKLQEGDRQIPEGIYQVEYLNPNSSYHLSIKINYPNAFDKSKTTFADLTDMGGDIFIHGKSVTIGCIPIGDEAIEELFVLTQKAMQNKVEVIISPRDFRQNPNYPDIKHIDWEDELYDTIKNELSALSSRG